MFQDAREVPDCGRRAVTTEKRYSLRHVGDDFLLVVEAEEVKADARVDVDWRANLVDASKVEPVCTSALVGVSEATDEDFDSLVPIDPS